MGETSFKRVLFYKLRKGDLIFTMSDLTVYHVLKKTRKLAKLENHNTKEISWITKLRMDQIGYYYLLK
jgi:hypothetical protein